ncbi:transposase [Nonomuraea rhodomycinica]|uniref:Transposase n=1 Tax=Nonomuraea rhodomycinica TaxID=1712872 RepID=A0A7Y6IJX2_9ACTN|nr:transposase [Nonomuraea rhodomycinica]NUW39570.1 transposase [Nonomuraea rhodomycinica]
MFACPGLTKFARLDELGLEVTGQRVEFDRAVLAGRVVGADQWCRRCGCEGVPRDPVTCRSALQAGEKVEVVAMDGFTGFKTAAAEELPDAAPDRCRYRPGISSGPTEAINGRLEHLRGSALGFRNLTSYIARSLPEKPTALPSPG